MGRNFPGLLSRAQLEDGLEEKHLSEDTVLRYAYSSSHRLSRPRGGFSGLKEMRPLRHGQSKATLRQLARRVMHPVTVDRPLTNFSGYDRF